MRHSRWNPWPEGGVERQDCRPKDKRRRQLSILQGLPGIGSEKVVRLLDNFGSVTAIVAPDSSGLQTAEGIGKNLADRIKWLVSEKIEFYGSQRNKIIRLFTILKTFEP